MYLNSYRLTFFFSVFKDGKECIKNPKGTKITMMQGPTGNVYIKDPEQQQHHIILGHKLV